MKGGKGRMVRGEFRVSPGVFEGDIGLGELGWRFWGYWVRRLGLEY